VIDITEEAAAELKVRIAEDGRLSAGLRITARNGGCSGLVYRMAVEDSPREDDRVLDFDGLRVFVDTASAIHLEGATIGYVDGPGGAGFRIANPNGSGRCRCSGEEP
jgi:iron-sulfur cluster assembly accessory protein